MDQALGLVGHWMLWLFGLVAAIFFTVENAFRALMDQLGIAHALQSIILLLLTIVLIVLAFRVFGGLFRILLMVFLVLLLAHLLLPELR